MFRRAYRTRLDRILAAVEIPAIGLWLGALCGFAFIFAPAAFRLVPDVTQFASLTTTNLRILGNVGAICGGIAIVVALVRSYDAADRTIDIVRAGLILVALLLVAYETFAIVPVMTAITDVHSAEFAELHQRSSQVYGGVVVLALAALVLAAIRTDA
jgi:Domain of unknown function (DUF4149)